MQSEQLVLPLNVERFELGTIRISKRPSVVAIVTPFPSSVFPRLVQVYQKDRQAITTWSTWSLVWSMRWTGHASIKASDVTLMRAIFPDGEYLDGKKWKLAPRRVPEQDGAELLS